MAALATCVWGLRPELVVALHDRFGVPDEGFGNGIQTWVRSDGPGGMPVQWRLHPRPDFVRPKEVGPHQLFASVAGPAARGETTDLPPEVVWAGLVAGPAYGDEVDEIELTVRLTEVLGLAPDACGHADLDDLGQAWERSGGRLDVVDRLLAELGGGRPRL